MRSVRRDLVEDELLRQCIKIMQEISPRLMSLRALHIIRRYVHKAAEVCAPNILVLTTERVNAVAGRKGGGDAGKRKM